MAISSKSKLREILADERAVAIIEKYVPGFAENPQLGPVMGMRYDRLLEFPQSTVPEDIKIKIKEELDALDA